MRHPFLRTLAGSAAPAATDPNFENVTLLLHGDGTNGGQNNTFVDGSTNNFTITRNGNTTQGTFSPYGDNWSNYFDGTGDYLNIADNAALDFGTGDFTIDLWFYAESVADAVFAAGFSAGSPVSGWGASVYAGSASFTIAVSDTYVGVGNSATIAANTWYHYAIVRSGNSFTLYINGVGGTAVTNTSSINTQAAGVNIGRSTYTLNLRQFKGYISNLRIVKGTAVYTANFTPPTAPLTAITNTSLLTCQSNRFRDVSTNNFTITRNGDVSVQRFSPFSPTAAYAAGTIGGSGYFDGTGDYLTVGGGLPSGQGTAFTLECWIWVNNLTNYAAITRGATTSTFDFGVSPAGALVLDNTSTASICTSANGVILANAWHHVAITRSTGNIYKLWVDGTNVATSSAYTTSMTANTTIGYSSFSASHYFRGYVSNFRVVSSEVYTSAFTPPTSPLTAITNTSLLLNFTNAAILDNAMMAVPETVGNAQISTSVKKYGTGSLYFDGTGDYLTVRNNPTFSFGTGDFTIECWAYIAGNSPLNNSSIRDAALFSTNPANAPGTLTDFYQFGIVGSGTTTGTGLFFSHWQSGSAYAVTATVTLAQQAWHHLAVARSGTTTKLFLNGSQVASGTLGNQTVNAIYPAVIGRNGYPGYLNEFNGYIDDLRITKGVARYTSNFTPPTAAFPDL